MSMPSWWNRPVTVGDCLKGSGLCFAVSALGFGVMIGIGAIQSRKEEKRIREWREALRQQEERTKKEEVEE